jgi:hypothetical protein
MDLLTSLALQGAHFELQRRVRDLSNEINVCQTGLSNCVGGTQLVGAEYQRLVTAVEDVFYRSHIRNGLGLTPDQMVAIMANEHQQLVDAVADLNLDAAPADRTPLEMVEGIVRERGRLQDLVTRCNTLLADCNSEKKIMDDLAAFLVDPSRLQKELLADALDVSVDFEQLVSIQVISYIMNLEETLKSFLRICGVNDVGDKDFLSPIAADSQGRNLAIGLCEDLANGLERLRGLVKDDDAFDDALAGYYFSGVDDLRNIGDIVSGKLAQLHRLEDQVRDLKQGQDCDTVRELLSACAKQKTLLEEQLNGNAVRRYPQYPRPINDVIIALAHIANSSDDVDSVTRSRLKGLINEARRIPAVKKLLE